jgi:hypothetical protein
VPCVAPVTAPCLTRTLPYVPTNASLPQPVSTMNAALGCITPGLSTDAEESPADALARASVILNTKYQHALSAWYAKVPR